MHVFKDYVLQVTGASEITHTEMVQELWSGYGEVRKYYLSGGVYRSVVAKHIKWPDERNHPRGWNTDISHQRKLKSYQVERSWYLDYSGQTSDQCKVPHLIKAIEQGDELLLIMEDLDESGYHLRASPEKVRFYQVKIVLSWLANFHARFIGMETKDLWNVGTYWHLDTRPDEWERMHNLQLKKHAKAIDQKLNETKFQTIVHGDAKLANFCFSKDDKVAAVDFQYVGRGCGMKDVAYFLSSCFHEEDCERYEGELLDHYFKILSQGLSADIDYNALREEWSNLYAFACADFYRFLDGWSPGHWKMHGYSKRLTQQAIDQIQLDNA